MRNRGGGCGAARCVTLSPKTLVILFRESNEQEHNTGCINPAAGSSPTDTLRKFWHPEFSDTNVTNILITFCLMQKMLWLTKGPHKTDALILCYTMIRSNCYFLELQEPLFSQKHEPVPPASPAEHTRGVSAGAFPTTLPSIPQMSQNGGENPGI